MFVHSNADVLYTCTIFRYSEKSKTKCIGITIETRPEYYLKKHLRYASESFQLAKDTGFKVVAHMMPDLPNFSFERDIEGLIVSV